MTRRPDVGHDVTMTVTVEVTDGDDEVHDLPLVSDDPGASHPPAPLRGRPELVRIPAARQDICWTVAVQVAGSDHGVEES